MLKILQARFQQYVNQALPDVQDGLQRDRGTRDQIANTYWIIEKAREFQKNIYFLTSLAMLKPLTVWITTNCGKFLKRWKTRPPYLSPEKSIRESSSNSWNRTWNTDLFKIGKTVRQGCMLSVCLFNFHAEYIMQNVRLDESQAGIKTVSRNINSLRYADETTLVAESEKELKILLTRIK